MMTRKRRQVSIAPKELDVGKLDVILKNHSIRL